MKFGIIGFGKMGSSILSGMIDNKIVNKNDVLIYDTFAPTCERIKEQGYLVANSIQDVFNNSSCVLFSVKPQELQNVFKEVEFDKEIKILTIMAGVKIQTFANKFTKSKICRVMPNTCAMIGKSASSVCFDNNCTELDKQYFTKIVSSFGSVSIIDESLMDEVIPLAGSFTAYAYYYIKSFVDSAIKRGVPEDIAKTLVVESMIGSAEMVKVSGKDLQTLINDVCSKGGTTLAGLKVLQDNNLEQIVHDCSVACAERSKELGKN